MGRVPPFVTLAGSGLTTVTAGTLLLAIGQTINGTISIGTAAWSTSFGPRSPPPVQALSVRFNLDKKQLQKEKSDGLVPADLV